MVLLPVDITQVFPHTQNCMFGIRPVNQSWLISVLQITRNALLFNMSRMKFSAVAIREKLIRITKVSSILLFHVQNQI